MSRLFRLLLVFILAMLSAAPALVQLRLLSAAETQGTVATLDADGVQRIRIVGGDYFFKPARVVVKANRPVEFLVSKEAGKVPHNLVIEAPAAGVHVKEDLSTEAKKISFTPTAPGTIPSIATRNCCSSAATGNEAWKAPSKSFPRRSAA